MEVSKGKKDEIIYNPARSRYNNTSTSNTIVIWDKVKYMPNLTAIQQKYLMPAGNDKLYQKLHEWSGTFNTVTIYMTDKGKKIAYRVGKDYFKRNCEVNKMLIADGNSVAEYVSVLNQSIENIVDASKHNISPTVYYVGLMNIYKNDNNDEYQYIVQISEAYDMDLKEYYANDKYTTNTTLTTDDIFIRDQLISLLQNTSDKLSLICFDIKPPNCVININTKEVKLIDWDADWCQKYDKLLRSPDGDEDRGKIDLLNIIIMANHFYIYCKYNIFYSYLQEHIKEADIESLKKLFCESTNGDYEFMSRYYFKLDAPLYVTCKDDVFTELITRARKLRKDNNINKGGKIIKHKKMCKKNKYTRRVPRRRHITTKKYKSDSYSKSKSNGRSVKSRRKSRR